MRNNNPIGGRRSNLDREPTRWGSLILLSMGLVSCTMVYIFMSSVLRPTSSLSSKTESFESIGENSDSKGDGCCKGVENLELWGAAVKWGTEFKFNSSQECCKACKSMCSGNDGPCLCDSWVFCGNRKACGDKFGEVKFGEQVYVVCSPSSSKLYHTEEACLCWLKKQKDVLVPDNQETGNKVMWTSGLVFGRGEGIVGLETEHGTLHIKLLPECSPNSVAYILELLTLRHCAGCSFYRAEGRGQSWDTRGNHIKDATYGPPFALIQGTLEVQGAIFNKIESEHCPLIRRGSVAWIGSGPEFFISLANHVEWRNSYTVFGSVLPEDMKIAEKIAQLPTKSDVWNNVKVQVLEKSVPLKIQRIKSGHDLNVAE